MNERSMRIRRYLTWGSVAGLFLAVSIVVAVLGEAPPPRQVRLATGPHGGAYHVIGERFAARLRTLGLDVELVRTNGSVENYRRLAAGRREDGVDLAFAQAGTLTAAYGGDTDDRPLDPATVPLRAVAMLYSEPLWLFHREELNLTQLNQLQGKRVNSGAVNSGTEPVARMLLEINGVTSTNSALSNFQDVTAVEKLAAAELDAVMLVSAPQAANVQRLLRLAGVHLMDFRRHVAYSRQIQYLKRVALTPGVLDLREDLPASDVSLLGVQAMLVSREGVHPRVVELFYKVAQELFARGNTLDPPAAFPHLRVADLLVHPAAERFAAGGENWFYRNLPYWAVRLISRLKLLLIPLVTVLLPALKFIPIVIRLRVSLLLRRHYNALREVDTDLGEATTTEDIQAGIARIDGLRDDLSRLSQKFSGRYQSDLYHWRLHLDLVRHEAQERLEILR